MSKPEQVLVIEPNNELKFKGPFNVPVTSYMSLTNPSEKSVMFKIKTTAPKKYCVRPNSGILDPGKSIEIAISLQPVESGATEKNKHKFMVQSAYALEGDANIDHWNDLTPDQLMDSKLKCVFEIPAEKNESNEEPNLKVSPKSNTNPISNSSADVELQKAAAEVQQLREEESSLRQENLRLKEEILQMKQAGSRQPQVANRYAPPAPQENMAVLIIVAVVVGLLGMILGKFAL